MERSIKKKQTYDLDLTVPIDKTIIKMSTGDCFGKMWDMSSKECPMCADRDVCSIMFKDLVDARGKEIEKEVGSKFLDEANFDALTEDAILSYVDSGVTDVKSLLEYAMGVAYCDDVIAVKNKVVEIVKASNKLSIKSGIVWLK